MFPTVNMLSPRFPTPPVADEDFPGTEPERHEYLEHKTHEANEKVGIGTVDVEDCNLRFAAYGGRPADYMCG